MKNRIVKWFCSHVYLHIMILSHLTSIAQDKHLPMHPALPTVAFHFPSIGTIPSAAPCSRLRAAEPNRSTPATFFHDVKQPPSGPPREGGGVATASVSSATLKRLAFCLLRKDQRRGQLLAWLDLPESQMT